MRRVVMTLCAVFALSGSAWAQGLPIDYPLRGDANNSSTVDLVDAIFIQSYLFYGGTTPTCLDEADVNDDGTINISDSVYLTSYLFLGGPAPPAPFPYCGPDPTQDNLSCLNSACP